MSDEVPLTDIQSNPTQGRPANVEHARTLDRLQTVLLEGKKRGPLSVNGSLPEGSVPLPAMQGVIDRGGSRY